MGINGELDSLSWKQFKTRGYASLVFRDEDLRKRRFFPLVLPKDYRRVSPKVFPTKLAERYHRRVDVSG